VSVNLIRDVFEHAAGDGGVATVSRYVMNPEPFEAMFDIRPDDIDELGHVNNIVYLRWVQDVAVAHWRSLTSEQEQGEAWFVVVRHEIDYKRPAFAGDQIVARTWLGSAERFRFERHTQLLRASGRKELARVRTIWCPIDPVTRRATDVSEELRARFSVP
jgi:acyl-CoA thioester hydrolase